MRKLSGDDRAARLIQCGGILLFSAISKAVAQKLILVLTIKLARTYVTLSDFEKWTCARVSLAESMLRIRESSCMLRDQRLAILASSKGRTKRSSGGVVQLTESTGKLEFAATSGLEEPELKWLWGNAAL